MGFELQFLVGGNNGTTPDATYSYDGEGRRVKKISSTETTVFVYDGASRLLAEYSTALAETQQVSYLTTDHLGSPRLITNENGAVTKRQDFAAFGDETLTAARASGLGYTSVDELRQDYTGYQKDNESGLEYAQARYYNTAHGRFTSVDPLTASATIRDPQSFNRYSYVLNSPYKFTDPLGLAARTSASFCAQWCQNSGSYVDGSAFRGRDTTFEHLKTKTEITRAKIIAAIEAMNVAASMSPPGISFSNIRVVARKPRRNENGEIVKLNGNTVFDEQVLATGVRQEDLSNGEYVLNLNGAVDSLESGAQVFLVADAQILEQGNSDRAAFENDDKATVSRGIPNIVTEKEVTERTISSDGRRMTVYVQLSIGRDGLGQGTIGTLTLRAQASYVDQYDSRTNKVLTPKKAAQNVRITLKNIDPATTFRKN